MSIFMILYNHWDLMKYYFCFKIKVHLQNIKALTLNMFYLILYWANLIKNLQNVFYYFLYL